MSLDNILLIPGVGGLDLQRVLFGAGEVGGIWDWSDRSTMFQDVAGTQPITASGQTRALHLDKSRGLVRGAELVNNGTFNTNITGWTSSGVTLTHEVDSLRVSNAAAGFENFAGTTTVILTNGVWYELQIKLKAVRTFPANGLRIFNGPTSADLLNIANTTENQRMFIRSRDVANNQLLFRTAAGLDVDIDNISVRELPGNHRYQASAASRPQYIEDETGHYGLYDGVDDFDETNAVDFTGTDKMTVWVGFRKLGDPTSSLLVELGTNVVNVNGSFAILPTTSLEVNSLNTAYRGTTVVQNATASSLTAPASAVVSCQLDLAAPLNRQRINGIIIADATGSTGGGSFRNDKLFFGRRAGVTFPANVREYMTIIRGAQTTTSLIEQVERAVRGKIKGLTW